MVSTLVTAITAPVHVCDSGCVRTHPKNVPLVFIAVTSRF
jgi:hypothetical protein